MPIHVEELLEMILLAIKDEDEEDDEGRAKGHEKNNSKGKRKDKDKENKKDKSTFLEDYHEVIVAYNGNIAPLFAAEGERTTRAKSQTKKKKKTTGNLQKKAGENALKRGNRKKYGLYKKLGLIDGPFEHKTGLVENILGVLDQIVNGEVNLPPGEHEELFELVREVDQGYTVIGTTWAYNERNEIIGRENQIRIESYDYDHDDAGNMTTNGRSIYEWNAKGQLEKVTFPDGFGQKYEYGDPHVQPSR